MRRIILTSAVLAFVAACAHNRDSDTSGTTTVTSGTPSGARVTNVREAEPSLALADALCEREAACNRMGAAQSRHPTEEACLADLGTRVPGEVASWNCSPAATSARMKDCLAAIRAETCDRNLPPALNAFPPCRANAACPPAASE